MTTSLRYFRATVIAVAVLAMLGWAMWQAAGEQWASANLWAGIGLLVLLAAWQPDRAQLVADLDAARADLKVERTRYKTLEASRDSVFNMLIGEQEAHFATQLRVDSLLTAAKGRTAQLRLQRAALEHLQHQQNLWHKHLDGCEVVQAIEDDDIAKARSNQ